MIEPVAKRILYIDDEPNIQLIVKTCLKNLGGWEVEVAQSAAEGLIKAQELKPDAIILDVMMPEMDGVACLQQLRLNAKTQAIPIVFLTSKSNITERCRFLALGAVGAIAKPFNPLTLVSQIAKFLDWNLED
ncbi:response regulator [Brasilonema octagenarum UFV-E1]|uniref:Response regulator n=1 Tax=Brasilonema sennae CENA114 TaxID=415709 RepID=A0A856MGJ8_9CYAN|nr:response regulator [Brasilonema sennae]QDL10495.1 response regulator [Brasilonema sennae CENA114]QDL16841.1 response regulator [Brasilonema octagenarum UFV-E1]